MDLLIVGLGNPGKEYEKTRHNAGFMFIDSLASKFNSSSYIDKFNAQYSKIEINHKKIILLKPQTYMNLSGRSVLQAITFYKLKPTQIWVVHDDIDLECARIKIKTGGGHGGHNGLKSLDENIGKDYHRIRLGIGKPPFGEVSNYVLQNFINLEMEKIQKIIDTMVANIELLLFDRVDKFLNKITEGKDGNKVRNSGST